MTDLISRQAAIEGIYKYCHEYCEDYKSGQLAMCNACNLGVAIEHLEQAPPIDSVPVVRCKDCKWWVEKHPRLGVPWCRQTHLDREADGYCEMGERSEDDGK